MKLNIPVVLTSLLCNLGHAKVTFDTLPSRVEVGQHIPVRWTSDRDYRVKELSLWQHQGSTLSHIHKIEHTWATLKGNHTELWKVPKVRGSGGPYQIWFEGLELLPGPTTGNPIINSSANAVTSSNMFMIDGGVALFPKEIAGIAVGSVVALVLFIALFLLGAREVRKRKSLAVDLPGPHEGGYSDTRPE